MFRWQWKYCTPHPVVCRVTKNVRETNTLRLGGVTSWLLEKNHWSIQVKNLENIELSSVQFFSVYHVRRICNYVFDSVLKLFLETEPRTKILEKYNSNNRWKESQTESAMREKVAPFNNCSFIFEYWSALDVKHKLIDPSKSLIKKRKVTDLKLKCEVETTKKVTKANIWSNWEVQQGFF